MPRVPESIKAAIARSPDFKAGEFVARRIFRGLGISRAEVPALKKLARGEGNLPFMSDWEAARWLLRSLIDRRERLWLGPMFCISACSRKEAEEHIKDSYPHSGEAVPLFFVRTGEQWAEAAAVIPKDAILEVEPPFCVEAFHSGYVLLWKDAVAFAGMYRDAEWLAALKQ